MENENLLEEIKSYSEDDLRLILETQKDLYTADEMVIIERELHNREEEKQKRIIANLPKEIVCPKCGGENPFENDTCQYCGWKFDKSKYYTEDWKEEQEDDDSDNNDDEESYTFHYIISFLIPLIGFILGAIMLGKDDSEQRSVGKSCIIIAVISAILLSIVLWLIVF